EPEFAQLAAMEFVDLDECTRNGKPQRPRLPRLAAALHPALHVEAAEGVGRGERLLDGRHERGAWEVITEGASVDILLARAGGEEQTADRFLPAADGVDGGALGQYVALSESWLNASAMGCWAT